MTEQDTYIIERYLTGKLSAQDAKALEARFREDPVLKAEAVQMRAIMTAVRQQVMEEKKALLREESRQSKGRLPGLLVLPPVWRYVAIAAILVLAIFMIRPLLESDPEIQNTYLAEHFDEFIIHDTHKGAVDDTTALALQKGYNLFAAKKFDDAVFILEKNWEVHRDTVSLFYLWTASIAQADTLKANQYEKQLTDSFRKNFDLTQLMHKTRSGHVQ